MSELVSVIMGIYNCADTLAEALDCIAAQTYSDWEIILCDDGSSDRTAEIAEDYTKKYPGKIRLFKNSENKGLNYTLNRCLKEARGDYIARMDGDDRCHPRRFEKEVSVLENHPELAIISSDMEFFDAHGVWGRTSTNPKPECRDFLSSTPFCHAACMVRAEAYRAVGGYSVSPRLLRVEDYHLWIKMYERGYRGVNIQEPLYSMRDDRAAQQRRRFRYRLNEAYVKGYAVRRLHLPVFNYLYCLKPIIVGLLPGGVYKMLHRRKQSGE